MSNPRTKRNQSRKAFRIVLSSLFHVAFFGMLVFAFVVSLDEDYMLDLAFEAVILIDKVKYVLGGILAFYMIVISLHFVEIIMEVRQTRRISGLLKEIDGLKAKIYDLTRDEEAREESMQAFKDSLED